MIDKMGEELSNYIGKKATILGGINVIITKIALEVFTDNGDIETLYIVYFEDELNLFGVKDKYWNAFFGDDEFQDFIKEVR